jgi:hypothetical protein
VPYIATLVGTLYCLRACLEGEQVQVKSPVRASSQGPTLKYTMHRYHYKFYNYFDIPLTVLTSPSVIGAKIFWRWKKTQFSDKATRDQQRRPFSGLYWEKDRNSTVILQTEAPVWRVEGLTRIVSHPIIPRFHLNVMVRLQKQKLTNPKAGLGLFPVKMLGLGIILSCGTWQWYVSKDLAYNISGIVWKEM